LKRKGALLVASSGRESFTLRFYPDREESLDGESLRDLELSSLEIQLTKPELRKFGLLGKGPAPADAPSAPRDGAFSEEEKPGEL
jgi:hypothetical protein